MPLARFPPHNSLRPCRVSARARLRPLSIPGFNVAFFEGNAGDFLFHRRSPISSRAAGTGRHPRVLPNIKCGGRGRSSRTTSGETARTDFLYEVVQYSFHQPLRRCQSVSCIGTGCKLELLHVQCVFEHPCSSSIGCPCLLRAAMPTPMKPRDPHHHRHPVLLVTGR